MKAAQYAEALYNVTSGKDDSESNRLVDNLIALLTQRGHEHLLPKIVREYEKLIQIRSTSDRASVRVTSTADREQYASAIAADAQTIGVSPEECVTRVDESIIGGYALEAQGQRIDRTHKRSLLELYSKLITSAQYV